MQEKEKPLEEEKEVTGGASLLESKTSHLDDELSARLEEALHEITLDVHIHDVAKIASEYNPIDLAYAASRLPASARHILFENIPSLDSKAIFMINTDKTTRVNVFRRMSDLDVKELISLMPADEAIWVLDDLPERRVRKLLELLEPKKASHIRELQQHSRTSAGGIMTNEFFAFPAETSLKGAALYIRDHPGIEMTRRIFVIDSKGELLGYVPARNLIVNNPDLTLKQVMRDVDHKLNPDSTREEVVDIVERYKISALPIVDRDNLLVGVITFEDVVEAIEDIADETIAWMGGTVEDISEHDPILKRFLARAPWLLATLCAGLISAAIMSYYQGIEAEVLAFIVFFIPLINGMSGNVGIQCSTVLVRSMATGILTSGNRTESMIKEGIIGLITGVVFGTLCGLIVYLLNAYGVQTFAHDPLLIGVTVACGLLGACLSATFLGVVSPFLFARIGVDPALASGPIVTAFNDIMSMIIYFVIAGVIASFFF